MDPLRFKNVLLEISNDLTRKQLEDIKFICVDIVKKKNSENIDAGIQLFQVMIERNRLGEGDTTFLCDVLDRVGRSDLSDKLNYGRLSAVTHTEPEKLDRDQLDVATDEIAARLGRAWRRLGRKLGLSEVKLDSISRKHPTDLEEITRELLKEWRWVQQGQARAQALVDALRACDQNLTADRVEDAIAACV